MDHSPHEYQSPATKRITTRFAKARAMKSAILNAPEADTGRADVAADQSGQTQATSPIAAGPIEASRSWGGILLEAFVLVCFTFLIAFNLVPIALQMAMMAITIWRAVFRCSSTVGTSLAKRTRGRGDAA